MFKLSIEKADTNKCFLLMKMQINPPKAKVIFGYISKSTLGYFFIPQCLAHVP